MSRAGGTPAPRLLQRCCDPDIAWGALKVALVVGLVLNAVNNGERLLRGEPINWWQVSMNFLVPYCVSCYSAARNALSRAADD